MRAQTEKYILRYLERAPVALALWRSIEAKYVASTQLTSPILDIGCGFGEFAEVFFEKPVDFGLDIDYREIIHAMKTGKYINYTLADARHMPYDNNYFQTVLSISTFEHIQNPEKVLNEAYRVLRPGGKFVATIVIDSLNNYIYFGPLFKKIGLKKLGKFYTDKYNQVFKHITLRSRKRWEKDIQKAGFKIEVSQEIISPKVTALFDKLLIFSWPSQVIKILTGKRIALHPKLANSMLTRLLYPLVEEATEKGNTLYIVARKPKR